MTSEDRLETKLRDRLHAMLRSRRGFRPHVLRRIAATTLLLLAAGLALLPQHGPPDPRVAVMLAARDLPPGKVLSGADVVRRELPADLVPGGALRGIAAVEGRALSSAVRGGEPLTDVRLGAPPTVGSVVTPDTPGRISAPVRLADPEVADFLAPGRRVDIVTTITRSGDSTGGAVLARDVPVVAVQPRRSTPDQGRLIFVGLPEGTAATVAAASSGREVTVTLR